MSESSGGTSAVSPHPPARQVIATFDTYADAESAVDYLSDQHFTVDKLAIVGRDIELVEQIVGRLNYGWAALRGAAAGALTGALFGWIFGLLDWVQPLLTGLALAFYGLVFGAVVGALLGLLDPYVAKKEAAEYAATGITAVAMEFVPRITRAQSMDVLSSQANLAGYRAVIEGSQLYGRALPMMMTAAGTVAAAKVFVMGAGVAGLQAIATARRLGGVVSATDVRPATKEQVESLGAKFLAVEDEGRVSRSRPDPLELPLAVESGCGVLADTLGVEAHAPAAAPDATMSLDQVGEGRPGLGGQRSGNE